MKFLETFWKLLTSEAGQVPVSTEGATEDGTGEVTEQADQSQTGADAFEQAASSGQSQGQNTEESFIDVSNLPEELKPHWRRMHTEYNKRLRDVKNLKSKAEIYDRFYSDPGYANEVMHAWARQNGFALTRGQQQAAAAQGQAQQGAQAKAPAELVEAFKSQLPPELHWMAESQANAFYAAQQMMMAPLAQQQQRAQLAQRNSEYDEIAGEMSESVPGWEDKERDMVDLLNFLTSDDMRHKRFGNKLQILYNITNSNAAAVSEATKRINGAVKNRTSGGTRPSSTAPNLADRIRKADKNTAWDLAVQAAENQ